MIKSINLKNYIETLESGKRPKGGASNSGVPSLGAEHINLNGGFNLQIDKLKFVPEEYFNSLSKGIIKKNDILIVKDGATTGKVAYVNEDFPLEKACINEHVFLVRPKKEINPKYLFYYFFSNIGQREILKDFRGATVGGISKEFIDIDMYIPKVDEQIQIIKILDKAKSLIDKRKEQIKTLDELVKSKFIEMFGEPFSNTKGWEKQPLNKLVTDDCTISYGIVQTGEEQREGIPVFRPVDIVNNRKPKLEELKKTTEEISNKYKKTILQGNELLMTVRANIGDVCVIDEEFKGCNVGRGIVPIRVKEEINPIFLKYQFESYRIQHELKALSKGITLIQLNMEDLRQFMLIVPPIELQNQFADFVNQVDKLKFEMEKSLKELEDNFNSLMQKAFKGELFN